MAKGKKASKPAPKVQTAQDLRQKANELRAKGRLLEARADILDAQNPPKRPKGYCGPY